MIEQDTISKVFDAARIEEIIGDFVNLKRRGANMIGLCPFHNEKTPSFSVSPSKGIYKCFGCGEAGNAVNFLMSHEQLSYPEAIKRLAERYNIEVEETFSGTKEEYEKAKNERESLFILSEFAQKYYQEILLNDEEGKKIGLSYFKERDINQASIEKFGLGYSLDQREAFTQHALDKGYKIEYLENTGLTIRKENEYQFDRFKGRVMFPIRNLSGKVIGFGARILKKSKKEAKYLNSPDSDIYSKSRVLYGLFEAKKAIRKEDLCYLVEGYTDVIRLHQIGIENVVASSGTSLTMEQAQLIHRFSQNVVVLYDGDPAGIKASLRGIDILLESGLNVKIVLLPEGEDPDSYAQKTGNQGFKNYIDKNIQDFIAFKTELLLADSKGDPVQRAYVIKAIVESISLIPDPIKRAIFIQKTAKDLKIQEAVLINEVNRFKLGKQKHKYQHQNLPPASKIPEFPNQEDFPILNDVYQEIDIIRLLLLYGNEEMKNGKSVSHFLVDELDEIEWDDLVLEQIFRLFENAIRNGKTLTERKITQNQDQKISRVAIEIVSHQIEISENWAKKHDIFVPEIDENFNEDVVSSIERLKLKKIIKMLHQNRELLKEPKISENKMLEILQVQLHLEKMKKELSEKIGSVIVK